MASNKIEAYKPRVVKLYDNDEFGKLLDGVQVATCMLTETAQVLSVDEASVIRRVSSLTLEENKGSQCSCCKAGPFTSRAQQTAHYKDRWHIYNIKRKLFGKPPVSLAYFNARQDDDSSDSDSDSDSEVCGSCTNPATELFAAATRHCKAFYTNTRGQVFCIYRCILHHRKEDLSTDGEGHVWVNRCKELINPGKLYWAIIMVSGGHFAAGIFTGGVVLVHKTLHAYVTRRSQGQAQGTRDSHGNAPRSAGASLRRYNQAQFTLYIQDVLNSWAEYLKDCTMILYRAVGPLNQAALFGKASPLRKEDYRVRVLPFPTKKPTFKEVQRIHATLTDMEVYDSTELFQKALLTTYKPLYKKDGSAERPSRKEKKASPGKVIDRAKSREPMPRELPVIVSSEDEGPCYIDSETPKGWIKALCEQNSNGVLTGSKKDLLIDMPSQTSTDTESICDKNEKEVEIKCSPTKKKKEKKAEEKPVKKGPQKIPNSVKRMWKIISSKEQSLETIIERWESDVVGIVEACNVADPNDGNTALHKAAIAKKPDMVTELLAAGGDPCVRNHQQQTPYAASPHPETRVAFRLFQACYPDKYNYTKSHIPGPLTQETLVQQKEKKAQQKRAKRQREKEKHVEKIRSTQFVEMNDVQKIKAVEETPRCFLCGAKLPKTPFVYEQYKFCTVKCLQNHRNLRPFHLPD